MATPNPLENTHSAPPPSISTQNIHIAGIITAIYGLEEVPPSTTTVSVLWLLHPRLQTKEIMSNVAATTIHAFNNNRSPTCTKALIAVAFDQRNHGTREVEAISNESWKKGNPRHAQDMFGIFHGTALDVTLLMDHIGSYIFNGPSAPNITEHLTLGISLGGHASWQCFFHDPRVIASVVIIGCPNYMHVMTDRARRSKRPSYIDNKDVSFLGSADFPAALVDACERWDPKGLLFGTSPIILKPAPAEQSALRRKLRDKIKGKKLLVCSGGDDKLVPYKSTEEFAAFLKEATRTGGWYQDGGVYVEDVVYPGIGHAMSDGMTKDSVRFICNVLEGRDPGYTTGKPNL